MSIEVRPFRREDREQLTALVNAHVAAVVPGVSVSVARVLAHLEREPGEFIVDPWVGERTTLVAVQRSRIVAAAHVVRYAADERVGEQCRDCGEIRWFLFWPEAPFWADALDAGDTLLAACVAQLDRWRVRRQYADGTLPAPAVYGVPEQWPHVRAAYGRAGFVPSRTEIVHLAHLGALPGVAEPPLPGLALSRSLGSNGTRFTARAGSEVIGYVEVGTLDEPERISRGGSLADIGNLDVVDAYRRRGVGSWLVAHAAEWLRLGDATRLLAYTEPGDDAAAAFLRAVGFRDLVRTARGWTRQASAAG